MSTLNEDLTEAERDAAVKDLTDAALSFSRSNRKRKEGISYMEVEESDEMDETDGAGKSDGGKQIKRKGKRKRVLKKVAEHAIKVAICSEVRKHPEIYQITHKEYSNKQLKDASWQQISKEVSQIIGSEIMVAECKKYWTALKESTR